MIWSNWQSKKKSMSGEKMEVGWELCFTNGFIFEEGFCLLYPSNASRVATEGNCWLESHTSIASFGGALLPLILADALMTPTPTYNVGIQYASHCSPCPDFAIPLPTAVKS